MQVFTCTLLAEQENYGILAALLATTSRESLG